MLSQFLSNIPLTTLKNVKTIDLNIRSARCNADINDLLQRTVLVGGKRLRPLLTYLFGNLFALSPSLVEPYAKAIELVHAASLSHDDVIDNAETRRGKPSINAASSNQRAVLAGDYLLADVIVSLTNEGNLELVREMSNVIKDLAEGEWLQLDLSKDRNYTREAIEKVALNKTASVMSWCCVAPAILAEHDSVIVEKCRQFGIHLGLAFQQMDDALDFSATSKKDHKLDLKNGIVNSVIYEWLLLNPGAYEDFKSGTDIADLVVEGAMDEAVGIVKRSAKSHLQKAQIILGELSSDLVGISNLEKNIAPIRSILEYLESRDH